MITPVGLVLAFALSASPVMEHPVQAVSYQQLQPGQAFQIVTGDQVFQANLVDPSTGECHGTYSIPGGATPEEHRMWLLGASHGPQAGGDGLSLVLMHQIRVGMRMEIGDGDLATEHRMFTAPVRSITLLSSAPSANQTAVR
jgi:hypothetical protein